MEVDTLNAALDTMREALGLPDDLPVDDCKEPEYAGGRACVLRALVSARLVSEEGASIWFRTYYG